MPTAVSCKQRFSVLKHVLHHNMTHNTTGAKVFTKIHDRTEGKTIKKMIGNSNNVTGKPFEGEGLDYINSETFTAA